MKKKFRLSTKEARNILGLSFNSTTKTEAAKLLSCSRQTIYKAIEDGLLDVNVENRVMINKKFKKFKKHQGRKYES